MEHCPLWGAGATKNKKTSSYQNSGTSPSQHRSLHKPQNQAQPQRAETKRKKEYDPKAWEKETSKTVIEKKRERERKKYCANEKRRLNSQNQINEEEIVKRM